MSQKSCPNCGASLPAHAPGGHCPRCLLLRGLDSDASGPPDGTLDRPARAGSVLDTIGATVGRVPRVLLRDTAIGEEPSPVVRPVKETDASLRYRIDGEIARGGMGSVLKGRDPDLGRDVAIKVLREDFRDNGDMVRRFVEEAQIGGQLQHPGVVPIYELGTFADRRPFFSMKLVKGQTLADLLSARSAPSDDLPRSLSIYAAIAQTMAYAHTRGVIHRDLKPSNVMVGSFGEVQVMDWGLAKVLQRGGVAADAKAGKEPPPETMIATARSGSDADLSHAGSILGTPSYMAPEQARGETEVVNERADVFALGSILCEILTGAPAFTGRTSGEIVRKAARGETADALARLEGCGAEAELVALARDCLAAEPEDRPRDASAVAERVTAYLSGVQERLRAAERDRAAAEARAAEQAKRRRVQAALGLTFTGLVLLGGAFAWWAVDQRRGRRLEAERAVNRALEAAIAAFGQARGGGADPALWAAARAAALQAREQADAAPAEVRVRVEAMLADIDQVEKKRRLVASLLETHASIGDEIAWKDYAGANARYRQAFRDYGVDLSRMAPEAAADLLRKLGGDSAVELASALDYWDYVLDQRDWFGKHAFMRLPPDDAALQKRSLFAITRRLDPDPTRNRIRDAVSSYDTKALAALAREVDPSVHPSQTINLLALHLFNWGQAEEGARLLQAAQPHHAGNYPINEHVAYFFAATKRNGEALPYAMAAHALRPNSAGALLMLGRSLAGLGRDEEALAVYLRLVRWHPSQWFYLLGFGGELDDKGDHERAAVAFRKATELALEHPTELLVGPIIPPPVARRPSLTDELIAPLLQRAATQSESGAARMTLAVFLRCAGRLAESAAAYREGFSRLAPGSAEAHYHLANFLYDSKRYAAAARLWSEAMEADPKLVDDRQAQHRYNAACTAALAAAGQGIDDPPPNDAAKLKLRVQARAWLQAELAAWSKLQDAQPQSRSLVLQTLQHWRQDTDLAAIRDAAALAKLPQAERKEWEKLWADVDAQLNRAQGQAPATAK
jgi:hypothetical protein